MIISKFDQLWTLPNTHGDFVDQGQNFHLHHLNRNTSPSQNQQQLIKVWLKRQPTDNYPSPQIYIPPPNSPSKSSPTAAPTTNRTSPALPPWLCYMMMQDELFFSGREGRSPPTALAVTLTLEASVNASNTPRLCFAEHSTHQPSSVQVAGLPKYRTARICRAISRPSSYEMHFSPYRASRSFVPSSSRKSHFNATRANFTPVHNVSPNHQKTTR